MGRPTQTPSPDHLLMSLLFLDHSSIGRYALAEQLAMTRAKTRSVLEYLTEHGYAESFPGRGGTKISEFGRSKVKETESHMFLDIGNTVTNLVNSQIVPENAKFAVVYLKTSEEDTNGLYERDLAVRAGADGAVTLHLDNGKWIYPQTESISPENLEVTLPPDHPYNLMVVVFASRIGSAYAGVSQVISYHCTEFLDIFRGS